jgi:hypothetical protein
MEAEAGAEAEDARQSRREGKAGKVRRLRVSLLTNLKDKKPPTTLF